MSAASPAVTTAPGAQARGRPRNGARYRCCATSLGANAETRDCRTSVLTRQLDDAVGSEILPLTEAAVTALPELREALERAWAALREPMTLQDELQERQRQQLLREVEQARSRLTNAAVLFADGDIDKTGYELLREKAQGDLQAATTALEGYQKVPLAVTLPPLETVLAMMAGWDGVLRDGAIGEQWEVLASLIERVEPTRVGRGQYRLKIIWTPLGHALRVTLNPAIQNVSSQAA